MRAFDMNHTKWYMVSLSAALDMFNMQIEESLRGENPRYGARGVTRNACHIMYCACDPGVVKYLNILRLPAVDHASRPCRIIPDPDES